MRKFGQLLQSHRVGALSKEQLLAEVDRHLSEGSTDAGALLATLNDTRLGAALSTDVRAPIVRMIRAKLERPATTSAQSRPGGDSRASTVTEVTATAILELTDLIEDGTPLSADSALRRDPQLALGTVLLGRFELIAHVGEGGMSSVYKAIDRRKVEARANNPYVAVKLLTVPFRDYSASLAVLQREALKLQNLAHPNIVRVIDCDRDGETVFMTMEYLPGETLKQKFGARGFAGLPHDEALRILESIAGALAFAHRMGIAHGDLKPGNVILTANGEAKVIDFGIARVMARSKQGGGNEHGDGFGKLTALTPAYASPEMLEQQEPDARDDIYAFACIANEIVTGRHPFGLQTATAARDAGLEPERTGAVSRRQFRALVGGLQFHRSERTPSIDEFMEQFRDPRPAWSRRVAVLAAVTVVAALAGLYLFDRAKLRARIESGEARSAAARAVPTAGDMFRDCPTCPLMRVLPAGRLEQGSTPEEAGAGPSEWPRHVVAIGQTLGIGVHEVTVGEFKDFVDATGHDLNGCAAYIGDAWQHRRELNWRNVGYAQTASHPVTCVAWSDARAYADWLSAKTGVTYRLPSASEWEYAARDGVGASTPWGTDSGAACKLANVADEAAAQRYPGWSVQACSDGYVHSAPVGSFSPSALGLQDMLGNVFEWVEDCWHDNYSDAPNDGSAWLQGDCTQREMRGGSWFTAPAHLRAAYRNHFAAGYRSNSIGFRVVRDMDT